MTDLIPAWTTWRSIQKIIFISFAKNMTESIRVLGNAESGVFLRLFLLLYA